MKKIIPLLIILLAASFITKAQYSETVNSQTGIASNTNAYTVFHASTGMPDSIVVKDAEFYKARSRSLKTAGFCFIGAGAISLAIGLLSFPKNYDIVFGSEKDDNKASTATTLVVIGSALLIGSTPFFILSNASKKKAKLLYNSQKTGIGIPIQGAGSVSGFTLSIPIGK